MTENVLLALDRLPRLSTAVTVIFTVPPTLNWPIVADRVDPDPPMDLLPEPAPLQETTTVRMPLSSLTLAVTGTLHDGSDAVRRLSTLGSRSSVRLTATLPLPVSQVALIRPAD